MSACPEISHDHAQDARAETHAMLQAKGVARGIPGAAAPASGDAAEGRPHAAQGPAATGAPSGPEVLALPALCGRLVEVSAAETTAALSLVLRLVRQAQLQKEPVAWICATESLFFPPDAARAGVDLDGVAVIRAAKARPAARAADLLLRSGGFGLVVMDLGVDGAAMLPGAILTRLSGLAKRYNTPLLCLTEKSEERPSLGSLVSLRVQAERKDKASGRYRVEGRVLKDKRHGPGSTYAEACHGPDGLR